MKKIIFAVLAMAFLMASLVIADSHMGDDKGKPEAVVTTAFSNGSMQGSDDAMKGASDKDMMKGSENESMNGSKGPVMEVNGSQVHAGLYNALQNVENPQARAALERNMNRFMEKYQQSIQNMSDVEIDVDEESGEMQIRAKQEVRYLGFIKGTATKRFNVENNGNIVEKAPWYRFMYAEQD